MRVERGRAALIPVVLVLAVMLLVTACGDAGSATTTTQTPQVSFGEGELPSAVPEDFPFPQGYVVGSTLVDGINEKSEAVIRVRGAAPDVVEFYRVVLPEEGWEIISDDETANKVTITFRKNGVEGEIEITSPEGTLTQAVLTINAV